MVILKYYGTHYDINVTCVDYIFTFSSMPFYDMYMMLHSALLWRSW